MISTLRFRRGFNSGLQNVIRGRLAIDFLLAVAGQCWSDLFRCLENVLVERLTFPVLIVNPEPVTRHKTTHKNREA